MSESFRAALAHYEDAEDPRYGQTFHCEVCGEDYLEEDLCGCGSGDHAGCCCVDDEEESEQ